MKWLKVGDENTTYFHKSVKIRHFQSKVLAIKDMHNYWKGEPDQISKAFVEYYEKLLGVDTGDRIKVQTDIINSGPDISEEQAK